MYQHLLYNINRSKIWSRYKMKNINSKSVAVSSVLTTVSLDEIVIASELNAEDKPLEEVLDEKKEDDEQSL